MVYILVIFAVVCVYLGIRFVLNRKSRKIHQLFEKHLLKIRALLGSNSIKEDTLSEIQKSTILAVEPYVWEDWDRQLKEVNSISTKYPSAILEYFTRNYPRANGYNIKNIHYDINRLTYDQLLLLAREEPAYWEKRTDIICKANSIEKQYPEGVKTFTESVGKSVTPDMIVVDKDTIAYYQMCCDIENTHEKWRTKQKDFADFFYKTCKDAAPNDGRYNYEVNYNHLTSQGKQTNSSIDIWLGFTFSYSSYLTERQNSYWIEQYEKIPKFKSYNRWFVESVYDRISQIILKTEEFSEYSLLVILIREGDYHWTSHEYQRHYKNLIEKLEENDVPYAYFDDLLNTEHKTFYNTVFIVDMICNPNSVKSNVEQIINLYNSEPPLLCYYSLIKEMSEEEIRRIIANERRKQTNLRQKHISFIKDCFTKVIKHPYFSYVAILNTFIGEAHGAPIVKSIWLENPERYDVKIETSNELSITYTIDGVSNELIMPYENQSMDECVMATYELFKKMDLLETFMEKGESIVALMNERAWLQRR